MFIYIYILYKYNIYRCIYLHMSCFARNMVYTWYTYVYHVVYKRSIFVYHVHSIFIYFTILAYVTHDLAYVIRVLAMGMQRYYPSPPIPHWLKMILTNLVFSKMLKRFMNRKPCFVYRSNASNDLVSSSDLLMQNPASLGMVVPCWATEWDGCYLHSEQDNNHWPLQPCLECRHACVRFDLTFCLSAHMPYSKNCDTVIQK